MGLRLGNRKGYGTRKGDPSYNPNADINCDGVIDIYDLTINGKNYGETY